MCYKSVMHLIAQPGVHQVSIGFPGKDSTMATKKCAMESMVEHLRVHVFDNGRYLRSRKLTSPNGGQIDPSILQIRQVRQELLIRINYSKNKAKKVK